MIMEEHFLRAIDGSEYDRRVDTSLLLQHVEVLRKRLKASGGQLKLAHLEEIRSKPQFSPDSLQACIYELMEVMSFSRDSIVARLVLDMVVAGIDNVWGDVDADIGVGQSANSKRKTRRTAHSASISALPRSIGAVIDCMTKVVKTAAKFHGVYVPRALVEHANVRCSVVGQVHVREEVRRGSQVLEAKVDDNFVMISLLPDAIRVCREVCAMYGSDFLQLRHFKEVYMQNMGPNAGEAGWRRKEFISNNVYGIPLKVSMIDWIIELVFEIATQEPAVKVAFSNNLVRGSLVRLGEEKGQLNNQHEIVEPFNFAVMMEEDEENPLVWFPLRQGSDNKMHIQPMDEFNTLVGRMDIEDVDAAIDYQILSYCLEGTIVNAKSWNGKTNDNVTFGNFMDSHIDYSDEPVYKKDSIYSIAEQCEVVEDDKMDSFLADTTKVLGRGIVRLDLAPMIDSNLTFVDEETGFDNENFIVGFLDDLDRQRKELAKEGKLLREKMLEKAAAKKAAKQEPVKIEPVERENGNLLSELEKKVSGNIPGMSLIGAITEDELTGRVSNENDQDSGKMLIDDLYNNYQRDILAIKANIKRAKRGNASKKNSDNGIVREINSVITDEDKITLSARERAQMTRESALLKEEVRKHDIDLNPGNSSPYLSGQRTEFASKQLMQSLILLLKSLVGNDSSFMDRTADLIVTVLGYLIKERSESDTYRERRQKLLTNMFSRFPELYSLLEVCFIDNKTAKKLRLGKDLARNTQTAAEEGFSLEYSNLTLGVGGRTIENESDAIIVNSKHFTTPSEEYGMIPERLIHDLVLEKVILPLLRQHKVYWKSKRANRMVWRASSNALLFCICSSLDYIGASVPAIFQDAHTIPADYQRVFEHVLTWFERKKILEKAEFEEEGEDKQAGPINDLNEFSQMSAIDDLQHTTTKKFQPEKFWRYIWVPIANSMGINYASFISTVPEPSQT